MNLFKKTLFVILGVSFLLFVSFIKSETRSLTKDISSVIKQQEALEENILVLEAELAYLTSPARLTKISQKLDFKTIDFNSTKPQLVSLKHNITK